MSPGGIGSAAGLCAPDYEVGMTTFLVHSKVLSVELLALL